MIEVIGDAVPVASKEFQARLRRFDASLLVVWHRRKRRWMVEQCVRHLAPTAEHTHLCQRTYCCIIEDPEGGPLPLGDHVFEKLARIDQWRKYGPDKLQAFLRDVEADEAARKAREAEAMAQVMRDNSRDHRRQLLQADHLMQQHDLRVNQ